MQASGTAQAAGTTRPAGTIREPGGGGAPGGGSASGHATERHHPRTDSGGHPSGRMRRARLKIANVDPWSVMKVSFLFSVAIAIMGLVAVTLLWSLLDMMGVFTTVGSTVDDVTGGASNGGFDLEAFFSLSRVLGFTTILALIDIVLFTALATVGVYLYNVTTDFVGGIEITLAEDE